MTGPAEPPAQGPMDADDGISVDGRILPLDEEGHLADKAQWDESVARALAKRDGQVLEDGHWWLIRFVRAHHDAYGTPPLMRMIIKRLKELDPALANSRYLYRLFPDGPVRLACKYGGLPCPESCI